MWLEWQKNKPTAAAATVLPLLLLQHLLDHVTFQ
jgi:hypothetical protein